MDTVQKKHSGAPVCATVAGGAGKSDRSSTVSMYLVEEEESPGQGPAVAAGVVGEAAKVEAPEEVQQVVPCRRAGRRRQHPAGHTFHARSDTRTHAMVVRAS